MTVPKDTIHAPSTTVSAEHDEKSGAIVSCQMPADLEDVPGLTVTLPPTADGATLSLYACLSWVMLQAQNEGQRDIKFDSYLTTLDPACGSTGSSFVPWDLEIRPETTVSEALDQLRPLSMSNNQREDFTTAKTVLCVGPLNESVCRETVVDLCNRYMTVALCCFSQTSCQLHILPGARSGANIDSERMEHQLAHIIQQLISYPPHACLGDLMTPCPLDCADLRARNQEPPTRVDQCVHETIYQQVLKSPNSPAICSHEGTITYEELLSLSSQVAQLLRDRGVGPDTLVPLCFPKTRWAMIAVLGVMLAGGAFVLLEPAYPVSRLASICETLESPIILCIRSTAVLAQQLASDALILDEGVVDSTNIKEPYMELPAVQPSNALYAAFTSGSTGTPKGVVIEHRAYWSAAQVHIKEFNLDSSSRVLQFASYAFDISLLKILSTMMVGGCLCVLSDEQRTDSFVQSSRAMRPTHAFLTPSFTGSLKMQDYESIGIHTLVLIGEKVTPAHLASYPKNLKVMNGYGPAECTPITTIHPDLQSAASSSNVGWSHCSACWVVDPEDHARLAPVGAIGELVIEGWNVGREYLNDISKTKESFISAPSWLIVMRGNSPIAPLYKTGDLVHQLGDGSLVYVGRKGTQVKLRGQRLELEEVETHARKYLSDAAEIIAEVITVDDNPENAFLALLVVVQDGDGRAPGDMDFVLSPTDQFRATAKAAQEGLRACLPVFMVPSVIIPLSGIPHTVTGKKDRRKLRDCVAGLSNHELARYRLSAPSNSDSTLLSGVAGILQDTWAQELNISRESIGLQDRFFDLGGNSISAMRVAARVRAQGVSLVTSDLLLNPNLASLVESKEGSDAPTAVVRGAPFSLLNTSSQDLSAFFANLRLENIIPPGARVVDAGYLTNYQRQMLETGGLDCFQFIYSGPVCEDRLRRACNEVWQMYPVLRTVFVPMANRFVQLLLSDVDIPFHRIETNEDIQLATTSAAKQLCQRSSLGPLGVSFTLILRPDGREHGFIIALSHLQYDGISLHFLLQDLSRAYRGESLVSRPDYFTYLYFRSQHHLDQAFACWKDYLHGTPMTQLQDPPRAGYPHLPPGMGWGDFQEETMRIPCPPQGCTLGTLVQAAWAIALAERYHELDIVFQQTVHGRDSGLENVDQIFGACINKLPFRIEIVPTKTVAHLLASVQRRQAMVQEFDYVDMPDIIERCTSWPIDTRISWHFQHQNIDISWACALDGTVAFAEEIVDGRPPIAESGMAMSTVRGDCLHLSVIEVGVPGDFAPAKRLVQRWKEVVDILSVSPDDPLEAVLQPWNR